MVARLRAWRWCLCLSLLFRRMCGTQSQRQSPKDQLLETYWAVQAGLLSLMTFTRHRLSPLAAFTSGAYFLQNGRRWQWICEVYTAYFKGFFLKARSQNVSGNKQQLVAHATGCPKTASFPTNSRLSGQPKKRCKDTFFHPSPPFHCSFCNCNSGGICTAWQFWVKLLLL